MNDPRQAERERVAKEWLEYHVGNFDPGQEKVLAALLKATEAVVLEEAAKMLEVEAEEVLTEWGADEKCPDKMHDPQDCNERCDGYAICNMTFNLLAEKLRKQAQARRP